MVAIPLLSGLRGTEQAEFATVAPLNLEPVPVDSGISKGQLRAAIGAIQIGTGPGVDRGGIVWNNTHYRVMGTSFIRVANDGSYTTIGDVGGSGPVRFEVGPDRLGIQSGTGLHLFDGTNIVQIAAADLGPVKDFIWIDGYWMATDGTFVVVTELNNPLEVKPLKYGAAEEDPDPITGLMKVRNEAHVVGRHTIQVFRNIGGSGFPFATIRGATIPYGCISASAKAYFGDSYAFVGSARNEGLAVFIANGGQASATRISTREIEDALRQVVDTSAIVLETRTYRDEQRLIMHLAGQSWCFLANGTAQAKTPLWYRLRTANGPYRPRNAVLVDGRHWVGDLSSSALGVLSEDVSGHFGERTAWEFQAGFVFNEGRGAIVRSLELIGLPGRVPFEEGATAFLSMTRDGTLWSAERAISMGASGDRSKRLQWRPFSRFANHVGFKFRGLNRALPGFARIEARIDPLGK